MSNEKGKWSFVVRRRSDNHAVTHHGIMCWYGTGETKDEAKAHVIQQAVTSSGLKESELYIRGAGGPENLRAMEIDGESK